MPFTKNCFINCPFDSPYHKKLLKPIAFTVISMGLNPRICENPNTGQNRFEYIIRLIKDSKFGIHDISRMDISKGGYPRFNMPFELGLDYGMKYSGINSYRPKVIYILDSKPHRYVSALSDLAGFDAYIHKDKPEEIIRVLREAFYKTFKDPNLPTGTKVWLDYQKSTSDILLHSRTTDDEFKEMVVSEYVHWVKKWISGVVPHLTT